jgi:hypothetical protein
MENEREEYRESLIRDIRISIQVVIDKLDIACIDKNTESRLINMCLQDEICQKGQYDCTYLENMIERELSDVM